MGGAGFGGGVFFEEVADFEVEFLIVQLRGLKNVGKTAFRPVYQQIHQPFLVFPNELGSGAKPCVMCCMTP